MNPEINYMEETQLLGFTLTANLINNQSKQINNILLNNSNLFNFLPCSPMHAIFYNGKALCAFA